LSQNQGFQQRGLPQLDSSPCNFRWEVSPVAIVLIHNEIKFWAGDLDLDSTLISGERFTASSPRLTHKSESFRKALVASKSGETLGYAELHHFQGFGHLLAKLIVKPVYRRQGIGRRILGQFSAQLAARGERLSLFVHAQNRFALKLYVGFGFKVIEYHQHDRMYWMVWRPI
jgi:ribosomal protein S18 acetylase RimI-like enzyme